MSLIPLKQTITITPATSEMDRFNRPVMGTPFSLKCRIEEKTKLVKTRSQGYVENSEAVSTAQIYLNRLVKISPDDVLTYTDELGETRTYRPLSTEIKRGLNGKAIFTVVNV